MRKPLLIVIGLVLLAGATVAIVSTQNQRMSKQTDTAAIDLASSNQAEKTFVEQMIPHHESAIAMASQVEAQSKNPEIKKLALDIVAAQQKEINDMRQWYRQWWQTEVPKRAADPHAGHGAEPQGAATFDEGFVSMMIPHHESAVAMAQEVLPVARHQEIKDLANAIIAGQTAEIEQMKRFQMGGSGGATR